MKGLVSNLQRDLEVVISIALDIDFGIADSCLVAKL